MTTTPFPLLQQVFSLSMWSNTAAKMKGSNPSALGGALFTDFSDKLTQYSAYVPGWSVVWGPAVFTAGDSGNNLVSSDGILTPAKSTGIADNAVLVAYNAASKTYVVAIAATNPQSTYDWLHEDFQTNSAVAFTPVGSPLKTGLAYGNISAGTQLGITILQNLMPQAAPNNTPALPQINVTLQNYLKSVASTDATLIFTGHSLGGALSPTLAFSLYPSQDAQSVWERVLVLPTAGATPGDGDFATAFNTVFTTYVDPNSTTQPNTFNHDLWNSYDVVPHAWDHLQGDSFPTYVAPPNGLLPYKPCIFGHLIGGAAYSVPALVQMAVNQAAKAGVAYTPIQNIPLTGTPVNTDIADVPGFISALIEQHVGAYFGLIGVSAIQDEQTSFWQEVIITIVNDLFPAALSPGLEQPPAA